MLLFVIIILWITTTTTTELDDSLCNIKKFPLSNMVEIFQHNIPTIPLLFEDSNFYSKHEKIIQKGSKQNLLHNYGSTVVKLTSSNTYSQGEYSMTLEQYINHSSVISSHFSSSRSSLSPPFQSNESYYLFGNNYEGIWKDFMDLYQVPPCRYCVKAGAKTFGLGSYHSGVSWHYHGPGFSQVFIGSKRWFLYPMEVKSPPGHHPNTSVAKWVESYYPISSIVTIDNSGNAIPNYISSKEFHTSKSLSTNYPLYECVIKPGEILYFPSDWIHATLNIDDYNLFVSLFLDVQLMKE